jgi:hypothetical protein
MLRCVGLGIELRRRAAFANSSEGLWRVMEDFPNPLLMFSWGTDTYPLCMPCCITWWVQHCDATAVLEPVGPRLNNPFVAWNHFVNLTTCVQVHPICAGT